MFLMSSALWLSGQVTRLAQGPNRPLWPAGDVEDAVGGADGRTQSVGFIGGDPVKAGLAQHVYDLVLAVGILPVDLFKGTVRTIILAVPEAHPHATQARCGEVVAGPVVAQAVTTAQIVLVEKVVDQSKL